MNTTIPMSMMALLLMATLSLEAQKRYVEEVFQDVQVTSNVTYGINASVLTFLPEGQALPVALHCDIYEPVGDTAAARPLVIMLHTGHFLPPQVNGGCSGTKNDASIVELAQRLARTGYVVASANYRLGWNPITPSQQEWVFTLINAVYRGVQDAKTCVRFFRKTASEDGNPFRVDTSRIVLWGAGDGGVVALSAATLFDVQQTALPKFTIGATPMILASVNGDVEGKQTGVVPPGIPYPFPAGDTLCYPNHVDYSSEFHLMVNLSGVLPDSSWLKKGNVPMISYHVPGSQGFPCTQSSLQGYIPPFLPMLEVFGSCYVQDRVLNLGNNDVFGKAVFIDPISQVANAINDGRDGFYPFFTNEVDDSSPWAYAGSSNPYGLATDPDCNTDAVKGGIYHDTIMQYFAPRACLALDLGCDLSGFISSTRDLSPARTGLNLFPNPVVDLIRLQSNPEFPMQDVQIFDLQGRRIRTMTGINQENVEIPSNGMAPGLYFARVFFRQGVSTVRFVVN